MQILLFVYSLLIWVFPFTAMESLAHTYKVHETHLYPFQLAIIFSFVPLQFLIKRISPHLLLLGSSICMSFGAILFGDASTLITARIGWLLMSLGAIPLLAFGWNGQRKLHIGISLAALLFSIFLSSYYFGRTDAWRPYLIALGSLGALLAIIISFQKRSVTVSINRTQILIGILLYTLVPLSLLNS